MRQIGSLWCSRNCTGVLTGGLQRPEGLVTRYHVSRARGNGNPQWALET